ncbi:MAG: molybdopterin oxidoreductase, partial [Deltaproteobacteria bacterium]
MEILKSTCGLCQAGCGVLIYKDGDEIVKIEGDPESPVNRGALCVKALASLDHLHHPDRLKYPLKRAGERDSGKWQRISWDEALDIVAEEFAKAKAKYGPESLV